MDSSSSLSRMKKPWKYVGFSAHKVPSLSKTAILSSGVIQLAFSELVTFFTKFNILAFTIP